MAILPILIAPDRRLKTISEPVARVDRSVRKLMDDMLETMYAAPGIGLAAVQVGVPKQIIVMDLARDDDKPAPRFFINPQILWAADEIVLQEEGCLSVPDFFEEVKRPAKVKVRHLDYQGTEQVLDAEGVLATCLQHEMDHLKGILFIDHLSRLKRSMILKKLGKRVKETA